MTKAEQDPRLAIRKLNVFGFVIIILLVAGVGGWTATAQLHGAVIAPGTLVVESNIKKVQHPTGGIVEMAVFKLASDGVLLQPRVLARTVNIPRAIVRLDEGRIRAAARCP